MFIACLWLLAVMPCAAQHRVLYRARHFTTADGLPSNTIYAMAQDRYGFLWMGGTNGLSRFDGYRFVSMNRFGDARQAYTPKCIGLLDIANGGNLLWASTSTYHHGCYSLRTGSFLHTANLESQAFPKRRFFKDCTALYSTSHGARFVKQVGDSLSITDLTVDNGMLPSNHVTGIDEDSSGRKWVSTAKGIVVADFNDASERPHTTWLLKGINILNSKHVDGMMACFSKDNQTCYVFDQRLRMVASYRLPGALGVMPKITDIIAWQGRCFYFTKGATFELNLRAGQFTKSEQCQVPGGYRQGNVDGFQFVANRSGSIWIFPPKGNMRKVVLSRQINSSNEKNKIYTFARNQRGLFFIATYGMGLFTYDYLTGELLHYTANGKAPLLKSDLLIDMIVDNTGCVWLSSDVAGITCLQPVTDIDATYYDVAPLNDDEWANNVRHIFHGKDGQLYASTKDKRLYRYDWSTAQFVYQKNMKAGIFAYLVDTRGHEWVCTRGDGLYLDGVRYAQGGQHSLPSNDIFNIQEDRRGRVWLATWGAGLLLTKVMPDGSLKLIRQYLNGDTNESKIHDLELAPDGVLYVATLNGLYAVDANKSEIAEGDFACYNTTNGMFPNNEVKCLKYANGYLWAGVLSSGVVRCDFSHGLRKMTFSVFGQSDGLADNDVYTMAGDRYGRLWIGGGSGLSLLSTKDNRVQRYELGNRNGSNVFTENGAKELQNGDILFGTRNGILLIRPKLPQYTPRQYGKVRITDVLINGNSIYDGQDSLLLDSALYVTKEINLSYHQRSVVICYSNLEFSQLQSQLYQVMMEGVDNEWGRPTTASTANYSSLPSGKYIFHVRALHGGTWGEETCFTIVVAQPWYNTWWSWSLYFIIITVTVYFLLRNARERAQLHQQVAIEKQVTEFRLNFFTHVTHEFRTPLAIIQNGVRQLLEPSSKNISKAALQTTQRGVNRLLRLVNQLMEFRKLNTGNTRLRVAQGDIVATVRDVWQDLWSIASQKEINYTFVPFEKHYEMFFDHGSVETIAYNLLSNAVKYTPLKGSVTLRVTLDREHRNIVMTVEDDGPGIAEQQMGELFKPFMHGYVSHGGMGIGLYTAHQLAMLHHGSLCYERVAEQGGSRFILTLPVDSNVYAAEEYCELTAIDTTTPEEVGDDIPQTLIAEAFNHQTIAIIEDDADMMGQIRDAVGTYFKTVCFMDGKTGYEGVLREKPDLVLCDVMLPDMDGYEIVKRLKAEESMRYIPVIMLTALDDEKHQIKGYQCGADDYMVKPCNFRLLIARIIQLIKWQQRQKKEKETATTVEANSCPVVPDVVIENRTDRLFKENVQAIVAQHISESDFSVDVLAEKMCMGRSKFYGKMKEIYGMPPNKYIAGERMRVAAELLVEGKLNVAEVSASVGITEPSYFNKLFKSVYGVSPSKYKG